MPSGLSSPARKPRVPRLDKSLRRKSPKTPLDEEKSLRRLALFSRKPSLPPKPSQSTSASKASKEEDVESSRQLRKITSSSPPSNPSTSSPSPSPSQRKTTAKRSSNDPKTNIQDYIRKQRIQRKLQERSRLEQESERKRRIMQQLLQLESYQARSNRNEKSFERSQQRQKRGSTVATTSKKNARVKRKKEWVHLADSAPAFKKQQRHPRPQSARVIANVLGRHSLNGNASRDNSVSELDHQAFMGQLRDNLERHYGPHSEEEGDVESDSDGSDQHQVSASEEDIDTGEKDSEQRIDEEEQDDGEEEEEEEELDNDTRRVVQEAAQKIASLLLMNARQNLTPPPLVEGSSSNTGGESGATLSIGVRRLSQHEINSDALDSSLETPEREQTAKVPPTPEEAIRMLKQDADRIAQEMLRQAIARDPLLHKTRPASSSLDLSTFSNLSVPSPASRLFTSSDTIASRRVPGRDELSQYVQKATPYSLANLLAKGKALDINPPLESDTASHQQEHVETQQQVESEEEDEYSEESFESEEVHPPTVNSEAKQVVEEEYEGQEEENAEERDQVDSNLEEVTDFGAESPQDEAKWDHLLQLPQEDERPILETTSLDQTRLDDDVNQPDSPTLSPQKANKPKVMLSPGSLRRKLLANVNLLETLDQAHMRLNELEHTKALALAQHETASLVQKWEEEKLLASHAARIATIEQAGKEYVQQQTQVIREHVNQQAQQQLAQAREREELLQRKLAKAKQRESAAQTNELLHRDSGTDAPQSPVKHSVALSTVALHESTMNRATSPLQADWFGFKRDMGVLTSPVPNTERLEEEQLPDDENVDDYGTDFEESHSSSVGGASKQDREQHLDEEVEESESYAPSISHSHASVPGEATTVGTASVPSEEEDSDSHESEGDEDIEEQVEEDVPEDVADSYSSGFEHEVAEEVDDSSSVLSRDAEFLNAHNRLSEDRRKLMHEVIPDESILYSHKDGHSENGASESDTEEASTAGRTHKGSFREFSRSLLKKYENDVNVRKSHEHELLLMREEALREKTRQQLKWLIHQKKLMIQWLKEKQRGPQTGSQSPRSQDTKMPTQKEIEAHLESERKRIETMYKMNKASIDSERAALNERFYREELNIRHHKEMLQRMYNESEEFRRRRKSSSVEGVQKGLPLGEPEFPLPDLFKYSAGTSPLSPVSPGFEKEVLATDQRDVSVQQDSLLLQESPREVSDSYSSATFDEVSDASHGRGASHSLREKSIESSVPEEFVEPSSAHDSEEESDATVEEEVEEEEEEVEEQYTDVEEKVLEDSGSVSFAAKSIEESGSGSFAAKSIEESGSGSFAAKSIGSSPTAKSDEDELYQDESFEDDFEDETHEKGEENKAQSSSDVAADSSVTSREVEMQKSVELRRERLSELKAELETRKHKLSQLKRKHDIRTERKSMRREEATILAQIEEIDNEIDLLERSLEKPSILSVTETRATPQGEDAEDMDYNEDSFIQESFISGVVDAIPVNDEWKSKEDIEDVLEDSGFALGEKRVDQVQERVDEEDPQVAGMIYALATDSFASDDDDIANLEGTEEEQEKALQDKGKLADDITAMLLPELLKQCFAGDSLQQRDVQKNALRNVVEEGKDDKDEYEESLLRPEEVEDVDDMRERGEMEMIGMSDAEAMEYATEEAELVGVEQVEEDAYEDEDGYFDWSDYMKEYVDKLFHLVETRGGEELFREWKECAEEEDEGDIGDVLDIDFYLDLENEQNNPEFLQIHNKMVFDLVNIALRECLLGANQLHESHHRPWMHEPYRQALKSRLPTPRLENVKTFVLDRVLRWDKLESGPSIRDVLSGELGEPVDWAGDVFERLNNVICIDMYEMEDEWTRYDREEWQVIFQVADLVLEDLIIDTAKLLDQNSKH